MRSLLSVGVVVLVLSAAVAVSIQTQKLGTSGKHRAASANNFRPKWHELETAGPATVDDSSTRYTFEQWKRTYGKTYAGNVAEESRRREIFDARLDAIIAHNKDASLTWKRGVNQFSDWTSEEWAKYNRAIPTYSSKNPARDLDLGDFVQVFDGDAKKEEVLPSTLDYRTWTNPRVVSEVKNQGACGNCFAIGATESLESNFAFQTNELPSLSFQQMTSCTNGLYTFGCGGGSAFYSYYWIKHNSTGLTVEWTYPFTDWYKQYPNTSACYNYTQKIVNLQDSLGGDLAWYPIRAGVSKIYRVTPNNATIMMKALLTNGPVTVGVSAGFWVDYEAGIFKDNLTNPKADPYNFNMDHVVQLVGYGTDAEIGGGEDYWIVKNSWGVGWGDAGYIRLYRSKNPANEPCGIDQQPGSTQYNTTVCGTSGILGDGLFPIAEPMTGLA